jgi:hypothetical protein
MVHSSHKFGTPLALVVSEADEGQDTLRITIQETTEALEMKLEGRVAGPWASELDRVWVDTAPQLGSRKLVIDVHNVTYADAAGKDVLKAIYTQTHAEFVTNTPWASFLAEEVTASEAVNEEGE